MRKIYALMTAMVVLIALPVCAIRATQADQKKSDTFFPVMGWYGAPDPDEEYIKEQAECGMTLATFASPEKLDLCQKYGLKLILEPYSYLYSNRGNIKKIEDNYRTFAIKFGKHPACYGYYIADEPGASAFPRLGRIVDVLRKETPEKSACINLFPNYAGKEQLQADSYLEYLNKYCDIVRPDFISYDNYFAMLDGGLKPEYYKNLESVRQVSLERNIPFWSAVLSTPHYSYRAPSEWDIYFQVFTSLAYGARGISYFTYFTPQIDNYRLGPLDQFGHRTQVWEYVRRCNLQIRALAPILLKLHSTGIYYWPEVPAEGCQKLPGNTLVKRIFGGRFLIGEFVHDDGSRWFMVVNLDIEKSVNFYVRVNGKRVLSVSNYTGQLETLDKWLLPGQGKLCKVE